MRACRISKQIFLDQAYRYIYVKQTNQFVQPKNYGLQEKYLVSSNQKRNLPIFRLRWMVAFRLETTWMPGFE